MATFNGVPVLRVATLNLLAHPHLLRERVDALAVDLADKDVDFLLLQEVLRRKSAKFDIPAVLGDALGMPHVAWHRASGRSSGNVTLSKHRLVVMEHEQPTPRSRMLVTMSKVGGREVLVINNHGAWGSTRGAARLAESMHADDLARVCFELASPDPARGLLPHRDERPIVIYGGDLNMAPTAAPLRFLRGDDIVGGRSTVWLDAWTQARRAEEDGYTIGPSPWSGVEHSTHVHSPYLNERHPRERYDHIYVYEWSHGHAGDPLGARLFATDPLSADAPNFPPLTISDHAGVMADLYLPPINHVTGD